MRIRKLFFLTFTLGLALVIAAFGSNGLQDLFTTALHPAEAAAPAVGAPVLGTPVLGTPVLGTLPPAIAGGRMVVSRATGPISPTVTTIEFVPAPEIPTRPPDAGGVFGSREGNTLTLQSSFVMTGTEGNVGFGGGFSVAAPGVPGGPSNGAQAGVMVFSGNVITGEAGVPGELPLPGAGVATEGGRSLTIVTQGDPAQTDAIPAGPVRVQTFAVIRQGELAPTDAVPAEPGAFSAAIAIGPGGPGQAPSQNVVVTEATKIYHDVTPMAVEPAGGTQTIQQVLEPGSLDALTEPMMVTVWGHWDGDQLTADVIVYQNPFMK